MHLKTLQNSPNRGITIVESRPIFSQVTRNGWHKNDTKKQIKNFIEHYKFGRQNYGVGVGPEKVTDMIYDANLQTFVPKVNHFSSHRSSLMDQTKTSQTDLKKTKDNLGVLMHEINTTEEQPTPLYKLKNRLQSTGPFGTLNEDSQPLFFQQKNQSLTEMNTTKRSNSIVSPVQGPMDFQRVHLDTMRSKSIFVNATPLKSHITEIRASSVMLRSDSNRNSKAFLSTNAPNFFKEKAIGYNQMFYQTQKFYQEPKDFNSSHQASQKNYIQNKDRFKNSRTSVLHAPNDPFFDSRIDKQLVSERGMIESQIKQHKNRPVAGYEIPERRLNVTNYKIDFITNGPVCQIKIPAQRMFTISNFQEKIHTYHPRFTSTVISSRTPQSSQFTEAAGNIVSYGHPKSTINYEANNKAAIKLITKTDSQTFYPKSSRPHFK